MDTLTGISVIQTVTEQVSLRSYLVKIPVQELMIATD